MSTADVPRPENETGPASPLALDPQGLAWVERTRDALPVEALIAQLFNFATETDTDAEVTQIMALNPGGVHRFPTHDLGAALATTRAILDQSEVPPLLSGDIEGGTISYAFATPVPNQMGIAACDDLTMSHRLAHIVARESRALGYDWSFTPVVDVNADFRSAIVGTRSYGSDPDAILDQARVYIRTLQSEGMAACAKHWPGDGFDERDQHLVTSVNPLDMDQWRATFGRIFRTLIDDGVMTIMSAHIALPAYVRSLMPGVEREAFRPASISRLLNEDLLRGELGFRGLIVSDATGMGGLTSWSDREQIVPEVIENGCDMFLFSRNPHRDVNLMIKGLRERRLSERRLYEAATRVLSLKAALGLHRKTTDERLPPIESVRQTLRTPDHLAAAREALGQSVTLVKDVAGLLPLDPQRHRRVVVIAEQGWNFFSGSLDRGFEPALAALRARGFEVRDYDRDWPPTCEDTDLVLYFIGQEATPTASRIYLDLAKLHGGTRKAMTQFFRELPTVLVSFGQPYYLFDAPSCTTAVNAYSSLADCQEEVVRRLVGETLFTGVSPVDPFCGREQLKW
jgi:beta-N-acetylhexosaminidase